MTLEEILKQISDQIENAKNYLLLADYYMESNPNLAYLSLENALFFENSESKKIQIQMMMDELKMSGLISVEPASIVILSYHNLDYTKKCLESIRMTCVPGSYEIIVIDNGSEDEVVSYLKKQPDIKLILNHENIGFPAGCNQGIREAAEGNDIFLLNNDTVMLPNSLYCLRMALYSDESVGSVGSMGSRVPNDQQEPGMDTLELCINHALKNNIPNAGGYEDKIWLVGFALLIRHDVQKKVGILDERFTPGCFEDNDYCYRILEAGYRNVLCHNCLIVHYGGKGFDLKHDRSDYVDICSLNYSKINEKWGFDTEYYVHKRTDLISFIEEDHPDHNDEFSVLDCGCGMGANLLYIKYLYPNSRVYGIELMEKPVRLAKKICNILQGNIEQTDISLGEQMDYILFGDVIEHLVDPYKVLSKCHNILKEDGQIIASIPNIMHYSVLIPLLKGHFVFEKEGIRDYTHLHNWTYENINSLFEVNNYCVEELKYTMAVDGDWNEWISEQDQEWFIPLVKREETAPELQFKVYQYLVRAMKSKGGIGT